MIYVPHYILLSSISSVDTKSSAFLGSCEKHCSEHRCVDASPMCWLDFFACIARVGVTQLHHSSLIFFWVFPIWFSKPVIWTFIPTYGISCFPIYHILVRILICILPTPGQIFRYRACKPAIETLVCCTLLVVPYTLKKILVLCNKMCLHFIYLFI